MGDGGSGRREHVVYSYTSKRWKDAKTSSPERSNEPRNMRKKKAVSVVYYLSRNGHLEHPHFMEVPLSCSDGLYLKDVISRLNLLRGSGMAAMYSWSSKRSYKNGFVWQDLSQDDYIHPVHGLDYVLKGSEIPHNLSPPNRIIDTGEIINSVVKRSPGDSLSADASTQIGDQIVEHECSGSPPPVDSSSSPDTLESLILADKRLMSGSGNSNMDVCKGAGPESHTQSGRLKAASSVLMQLLSCGSFSFGDCGATAVKDHGLRLISEYRGAMASDTDDQVVKEVRFEWVALEDKEYFSGSVEETSKTNELHNFHRSSSDNADRSRLKWPGFYTCLTVVKFAEPD